MELFKIYTVCPQNVKEVKHEPSDFILALLETENDCKRSCVPAFCVPEQLESS